MQDMGRRLIASGDLNFREYERVLSSENNNLLWKILHIKVFLMANM